MALKINVVYKGIIYRVKGIKVLCSVVLAVILLLIAIVGMGVWMLVNVYDEEKPQISTDNLSGINNTLKNEVMQSHAPSIDFGKSDDGTVPSEIYVHNIRNEKYLEKSKENVKKDIAIVENPEVDLSANLRRNDYLDTHKKELSTIQTPPVFEDILIEHAKPVEIVNFEPKEIIDRVNDWEERVKEAKRLPPNLIPKNINTAIIGEDHDEYYEDLNSYSDYYDERTPETKLLPPIVPSEQVTTDEENEFEANLKTLTRIPISTNTMITRRHGTPSDDEMVYVGPPVVGYGANPYEKLTRERIHEYDDFWKAYAENKHSNKSRPFMEKTKLKMQPHLRGLRPSGVEYDLPVRPDAQAPMQVNPGDMPPPSHFARNPSYPDIQRHQNDVNRRLLIENQTQQNYLPQPSTRPNLQSNPLQEMYDYSKKLAASLLSFNSKSPSQIRDSSEKLAEYGINLIESHNHIFKQPTGGPFDRIVSLIPSADRLRSLDPFELSLVTWTFLDFWEFLIEKVGTLSEDDLHLLQKRLERLRQKKDDTMTRVLVNETLTRYSPQRQRSFPNDDKANSTYQQQLEVDRKIINDKDNKKEFPTKVHIAPIPSYTHILGNLFPNLRNVDSNTKKEENHPGFNESLSDTPDINREIEINSTTSKLYALLREYQNQSREEEESDLTEEGRSMWDPLGIFTSEGRMQFMQFAVKVLFNFGKVYLKRPYALDCSMLLFCKDLNQATRKGGMGSMAAKLKSVGLKVLTESEQQLRETDTFAEVWRSVTAWTPLQCDVMFPRCDGPKALEIVNEVALGTN